MLKFSLILGWVTGLAACALGVVNQITQPRIARQQELALKTGLYAVLPGSENGCIVKRSMDDGGVYYAGYQNQDTTDLIGYALPVESKGYSSTIRTLAGLDSSQHIIAINILFQQETPGLGTQCEQVRSGESKPWFQAQFTGLPVKDVALAKNGGQIHAITGATITSAAITDAVRESAIRLFKTAN